MAEDADRPLTEILFRLQFVLQNPVDFRHADAQTTRSKVRLLAAATGCFNMLAVADLGGRSGRPRGEALVDRVVATAFQTYSGYDLHPGPFEKVAMLPRWIAQGHHFTDGNKRTGFLTACYFLERIGNCVPDTLDVGNVVNLCTRFSEGELRDIEAIATEIERIFRPQNQDVPGESRLC